MRLWLLIFAGGAVSVSVCSSVAAQVPSNNAAHPPAVSMNLCSEKRIICVSDSTSDSPVTNPFQIQVQVNSADDIQVGWQIRDSTGQMLEASSTYDYSDQPTQDFTPGRILHIQAFIFKPSKSSRGTLTLTPSRYTIQTGGVDMPGVTIPVRLTTAKSGVTILEPDNPDELKGAASEWGLSEDRHAFNPKLKLRAHRIEIMRFDRVAIIGATVEAALRFWPGQSPWHVTHWRQSGRAAYVSLTGGGWLGVSYYGTEVGFLIDKSVLRLPGITKVVFE